MFYTVGQRQGLGIGGLKNYSDAPWFVADKNIETNELVVVQGVDHPKLFATGLLARQINWIGEPQNFLVDLQQGPLPRPRHVLYD